MRERFYVRELVGTPIDSRPQTGGNAPIASYYVLDRPVNCCVVATFERLADAAHRSRHDLRKAAEACAAELNQAWRRECEAA